MTTKKKYNICITTTFTNFIEVEADNEDEAFNLGWENMRNIELDEPDTEVSYVEEI